MKIYIWKLRFAAIIMVRAMLPWRVSWMIADAYEDLYGTDDSPYDAVTNELSRWGK